MSTLLILILLVAAILAGLNVWTRRAAAAAEAAVPKLGTLTPVPGGRIHWVEAGQGPPVICIHGLGGNLRHFTHSLTPLLAEDFRVIALDRPGSGWSEREGPEAATLSAQAAAIAALMDAIGVETATIVGHSLGGALALTLAVEHPRKVAALALLCPLTAPMEQTPPAFRGLAIGTPWLRRLLSETAATPVAIRQGPAVLAAVFKPETPPEDFPIRAGGALGLRPQGYLGASEDLMAAGAGMPGLAARLGEVTAPGGILYGAADAILDPTRHGAEAAAKIDGFASETLEGRGHMIPITAPEETADFIRRMAARAA